MFGMAEFIVDHWQLIASFVLALFNLVITLGVHALSTTRIKNDKSSFVEALQKQVEVNNAIIEVLNHEKESK